ncbi:MAG: ribose transport system substrate-binding protein [Ilumatobacteraceae bacterium]
MKKFSRAAAVLIPLALLAAACGSDDNSSTATPAAGATDTSVAGATETSAAGATETSAAAAGGDGLSRAKQIVADNTKPSEKIGPTIPLTGVPPKKKVAWLECEQPSCVAETPGITAATKALGWDLVVIPAASGAQGPAIQQALDQGVDYIAHTGSPLATAQAEIDAAKAKGVPYGSCYGTDDPDFENNNLLLQCSDEAGVEYTGGLNANWIIANSEGKAHVLIVNIPDFPVLIAEADGSKATYAENCPDCVVDELNTTANALIAGEVPAAVVAKVQADPSINYIDFTFGDLPAGVKEALDAAGLLKQVTLTGVDFSVSLGLQGIIDGTHAAWTANPKPYAMWLIIDAFARHSLGMDNPEERANAVLPSFIVDNKALAEEIKAMGPDGWPGPATMEDQFKALWGV